MALNRNELVQLGKIVAKADPSAGATTYSFKGENFTYEVANETFRREMNEYASTYAKYRENKNLIFSVIEEILDDILPKKVEDIYDMVNKLGYKDEDAKIMNTDDIYLDNGINLDDYIVLTFEEQVKW